MIDYTRKHYVAIGETVTIEMPYSEVCMHMRVAGKVMMARIEAPHGYPMAQLYLLDGREFSSRITTGEAGFYRETVDGTERFYCYLAGNPRGWQVAEVI